MSITRSDNLAATHPKPEWEHYRFFVSGSGTYRDYANQAEVLSTISPDFRANKTVRIGGKDYLIDSDGTTFISKDTVGTGYIAFKRQWKATGGETSKAVAGAGVPNSTIVWQGVEPLLEYTAVGTVPAGYYRYNSGPETIDFGTPLAANVDYIFLAL